jgi:4-hydroxy-tetrahydrodipicolinate synthase
MSNPLGVIIPCTTVFGRDGGVDIDGTTSNMDWFIESGVHALLVSGSCGEFSALEEAERTAIVEAAIEVAAGRIPVYVGVMHTSTRVAQRLAKHAEDAGASAVMSVPPYYSSGPERETMQYFDDPASSVDIPLIVYNNPGASGIALSIQQLGRLAQDGTARMIKESHGDPARLHDLRLVCPETTTLIYGEDYGALEALAVGADGWVAGIGNIVPDMAVRLWNITQELDLAAARELWFELLPLINMTSFKPTYGRTDERPDYIQIFKSGLSLRGRPGGDPRRPLLPLPAEDVEHLHGLLTSLDVLPSSVA